MKKIVKSFKARPGHSVDFADWPTLAKPVYASKAEYPGILEDHADRLSTQQELLFAAQRHALLIIFQAMDSGGKDGCIKHVMSGVNPQGCDVFTYRHPSPVELRHDFLWRTTRDLPEIPRHWRPQDCGPATSTSLPVQFRSRHGAAGHSG